MPLSQTSVALAAIVFSLTACGGGGIKSEPSESLTLAQQIDMLEKTGQLPMLDRSNDIKGPDTNNNGIRDDIDAWITAQPITDAQKKAAQQMARVQQAKILVDLSDKSALQMLGDQSMRAVSCLVDVSKPNNQQGYDLIDKVEALTANTRERAKQYLAYNRAVSGSSGRLPKGNTCEP
ncbi:MAG: hypothetical protein DCF26_18225 [Burkholderiales bacterium]|nr:MAG: hypothetical protein DCF26_18225 [Burkholderiales bacterium]